VPAVEPEPKQSLSEDQIEAIAARLRAGEPLDDYLRPVLFQTPKEYELNYSGKASKSRILAETMAVPLQPLRRYGGGGGDESDWSNQLIFGDNLQVLKTLLDMKTRGQLVNADGSSGVRLCYIDPPFATRQEFSGRRGARAYRDKVVGAAFVEFLRKRLTFIYELLADDGSLYLHLDTRKAHYMKVILDELFGENNFRSEIIWKRTTAHSGANRYGPVHDLILFYTKSDTFVWNKGVHSPETVATCVRPTTPERLFVERLLESANAAALRSWFKSPDVGFYSIEYGYQPGGNGRSKRGTFNPDFFLWLEAEDRVVVVEIKGDDDVSDVNVGKLAYAAAHFKQINSLLASAKEPRRYEFHFVSPTDYDDFFAALRDGSSAEFVSSLQAALA
jgi:hypothetical protein